MIEFIVCLVLLTTSLSVAWMVHSYRVSRRRATARDVRQRLLVADRQIGSEHLRARRAMNDAAGQSWRNLAG